MLAIGVALSACSADPPQARFEDYEARLFRTLNISATQSPLPDYPRFPAQRDLPMNRPREDIDILDLWSIRECALQGLVAQRNSSLGRVARPSTQMFYELDFLRLAPACVDFLERSGREELAVTLRNARARKVLQLPQVIWHGLLGGEEYRRYWKLPQRLGDYPETTSYASDAALKALAGDVTRWLSGDYRFNSAEVESHLQTIRSGDGGALYKSAELQGRYLALMDTAIRQRLQKGPVCRSSTDSRARILDTVVRKYFIGRIQPWSVRLQGRAYASEGAQHIEQLLAGAEPAAFSAWRKERDNIVAAAMKAPRRHVEALLPAMRQCGLAP